MSSEIDRLKQLLKRDDFKSVTDKKLQKMKDEGVDFTSFDSIKSNMTLIYNIEIELYEKGDYIEFNVGDSLLLDSMGFIAPSLMFSIYPEIATYNKIECYVNRLTNADLTFPQKGLSVNHKKGCLYVNDCSNEVILNNLYELVNHNINECDKQHNFSTPLDIYLRDYIEDYKESIGIVASSEQIYEL